jgi:hypothetical protein
MFKAIGGFCVGFCIGASIIVAVNTSDPVLFGAGLIAAIHVCINAWEGVCSIK